METPSGDKGRLGGKFEGYKHTPKDDMWARIAAGQGASQAPGRYAGLFAGYTHLPHARVWRRIARTLQPRRGSVILLRWSIAASLVVLLGWSAYQVEFSPKVKPLPASTFAERQVRLPNDPNLGCGRSFGMGISPDEIAALLGQPAATKRPASVLVSAPTATHPLQDPGQNRPSIALVQDNAAHDAALHDAVPADSQAIAQQKPAPRDSFITEVFPEIELPQGDQPENALTLNLGSSMLPGNNGSYKPVGAFERDFLSLDASNAGSGGFLPNSDAFSTDANESYQTPLSFGFFADLPLSRRWSLGLGTSYTLMRSDFIDRSKATRQYLGLGTRATFTIAQAKRGSLYALSGLQLDFGVAQSFQAAPNNTINPTSNFKAGNHLSAQLGLGVDFKLNAHFALYGQLAASSYLYQSHANLWSQRGLWPTAQVGLRMKL